MHDTQRFHAVPAVVLTSSDFPTANDAASTCILRGDEVAHPVGCIHEMFEAQVARTPTALAISDADQSWTYAELNAHANRLAHYLRSLGVRPGTLVGVALERSLEMVAVVYAVLKAGGAYVPLDPAYPPARIRYMIESVGVQWIVTTTRVAEKLENGPASVRILLDAASTITALDQCDTANPEALATPDDLIYVIFTSGSTGQPKAAGVYHRGFSNLLAWFTNDFEISPEDQALLMSSLSFDLTQKNLYATLVTGGQLHLYPAQPYNLSLLRALVQSRGITLLNCTPSAFYPLIDAASSAELEALTTLRMVFLGGEPIATARVRSWLLAEGGTATLVNTYGPTECTDICGSHVVSRETLERYAYVPLGRAIHNVQLAIVSADLTLCPAGTAGELCVGGAGVGVGYLNDAQRTSERFVDNPFESIDGRLLYRTGDQVRLLPSGDLEFLGRLDHQIKLRGYRIELPEIERALAEHPDVKETVVVAQAAANVAHGGDAKLACFFVASSRSPSSSELRDFLKGRLPDYMVPSAFHELQAFPLSPNGKVDRRSLSAHAPTLGAPDPRPARSKLEARILSLWLEVLQLSHAGLEQNFFDLGGNSIQLASLHARLEKELGRSIAILDLFAHATVEGMAQFLSGTPALQTRHAAARERALRQVEVLAARRAKR